MRRPVRRARRGFALVMVLIVITVLGILAGSFAYSMKVEMRLAQNSTFESELEWLGRSGVELGRYVLGQSMGQPYTSLNQLWAGGPGGPNETNSVLAGITLLDNKLGSGRFSVRIKDLERKFNVNLADQDALTRALKGMGVDAGDNPLIVDSILDWRDPDDNTHLSGTESDFYLGLTPPYTAKNGPIDDLSELLLIRGITPDLYWGPGASEHRSQLFQPNDRRGARNNEAPSYSVGLVDLFTPLSNRQINLNTASVYVLQMLPGVDVNVANNIINFRAGPDGVDGSEDDTPFQSVAMVNPATVPGLDPVMAAQVGRLCGVTSMTFEIIVDAQIGKYHKRYTAIVRRNNPRDVQILQFSWK